MFVYRYIYVCEIRWEGVGEFVLKKTGNSIDYLATSLIARLIQNKERKKSDLLKLMVTCSHL